MPIFYVTFAYGQAHETTNSRFDHECVGLVKAATYTEARRKMNAMFGNDWDRLTPEMPDLKYYPRGLVEVVP